MRIIIRRSRTGTEFVHPLDPAPTTLVLCPGFQGTRTIRVFPNGWSEEAARFLPCAIAAPMKELRDLVRAGIELQHAVIVLTQGNEPALLEEDRDLLWDAFGVPVFEQCIGPKNELLAAECEAHDGLHVVSGDHHASLERAKCGCGSSIPRRMPARQETARKLMYA